MPGTVVSASASQSSRWEPAGQCAVFSGLVAIQPFDHDGIAVRLGPEAGNQINEFEVANILRTISAHLKDQPEFRRLVVDVSELNRIPDEARGPIISLLVQFKKRDGVSICCNSNSVVEPFRYMRLTDYFLPAGMLQLPACGEQLGQAANRLGAEISATLFREARIQARSWARQAASYDQHQINCNGNLLYYRIENGTAIIQLNPEILSLREDSSIAERFRDAAQGIADSDPDITRVLFNLRGLEFLGADSMGVFITLHHRGKQNWPTIAVCGLEGSVAEKFRITRLDRLIPTFPTEADAMSARW